MEDINRMKIFKSPNQPQIILIVLWVLKYYGSIIAAVHNVIVATREQEPWLSWHTYIIAKKDGVRKPASKVLRPLLVDIFIGI